MNLLDLDRKGLTELFARWGFSDYYAVMVWRYLYRSSVTSVSAMHDLVPELRQLMQERTTIAMPDRLLAQKSKDGTVKYLLSLQDGEQVETVLMPYRDRFTVCISTQAGCAMGCVFCATGQMGFRRNLSAGEIVAQVLFAKNAAEKEPNQRKLRNIVLMGMGEPLHNYKATMAALRVLTSDTGLAIGPRYITVSTVGLVPAIRRLAEEELGVNLAVSLHSATDEERRALVPLARRWPLAELLDACRYYSARSGRRIFFEWTLIAGKNDTPEQAHALGRLLGHLDAHVNLIPLNPTPAFEGAGSRRGAVAQFKAILEQYGVPNTVRQRRGIDIDAGCGQLRQRVLAKQAD